MTDSTTAAVETLAARAHRRLGENLRTLREGKDMPQAELAQRMSDRGWPYRQQTIHKIETSGQRVSFPEAVDLAAILAVSLDRFTQPPEIATVVNGATIATGECLTWRYDGKWTQAPQPFEWDGTDAYEAALDRAGFTRADSWGPPQVCSAVTVEVFQHAHDERWIVDWQISNRVYIIEVAQLPNLLDLLSKLAGIAMASLAGDGT